MAPRPSNSFRQLAGVEVLYDRLDSHYGVTGIPYDFHCTEATESALDAMFADLFERTVPHFGAAQRILSAGAWVEKPGQHGLGKAFDLDAIHWERLRFIALEQPIQTHIYLAVQAICHKHFGVVLSYDFNADHHDHLHVDSSQSVAFRPVRSTTTFVQRVARHMFGHAVHVDGEYGKLTEAALKDVLARLGIADIGTQARWKAFLHVVSDLAISRVTARLQADSPGAMPAAALTGPVTETVDDLADDMSDPASPTAEDTQALSASLLSLRPQTGMIDLAYKPYPDWRISSRTVNGREQWYADFAGLRDVYLGYLFTYSAAFKGLARTGSTAANALVYDHQLYRPQFGEWATFLVPTGRCESEGSFLVVNAWDIAAMTLGFFQMAAHTGEHLAELFVDLIRTLPAEAQRFFPEIRLGSQIGAPKPNKLYAVNGSHWLDLDAEVAPADGLGGAAYYRGNFMTLLNPHRGRLDAEEVAVAARWIAWMTTSSRARDVCVTNAVKLARRAVESVHAAVLSAGHPAYPRGLDGVAMALVAAAMDVKHHGRRNRDIGESVNQSILGALTANDPMAAFAKIDTDWREKRSIRSVQEIAAMRPWFDRKVYRAASEGFVSE